MRLGWSQVSWKRLRRSSLAMLTLISVLFGSVAVYALLTSITVQNNITIAPGVSLGVYTTTANPTTCPALGSISYGTTTPYTNTVAWAFNSGGSQTQYFCIENQGSGNDNSPSITLGPIPATITCATAPCLTLTTLPVTIPALAAQTVSAPIAVTIAATMSTTGTGSFSIIVS